MTTDPASSALLSAKLQLKPGMRGAVVGAPGGFGLGGEVEDDDATDLDFVVVFCPDAAAVQSLVPPAIERVRDDGLVWLCYPKAGALGTDINRDRGWAPVTALGFRGVRQVAVDATWSALRFRRREHVGR